VATIIKKPVAIVEHMFYNSYKLKQSRTAKQSINIKVLKVLKIGCTLVSRVYNVDKLVSIHNTLPTCNNNVTGSVCLLMVVNNTTHTIRSLL